MNLYTPLRLSTLGLACALLTLSGCSTLEPSKTDSDSNPATASGPLPPAMTNNQLEINRTADAGCAPAALAALAAALPDAGQQSAISQTLFLFGTDKHDLSAEATSVLTAHATLLQQQAALRLKITGHTDERGTADYNLALGERRANTVATFLTAAGIKPEQMQVVSYGEEKPLAIGADEAAWSQNRRVELAYAGCAP